MPRTRSNLTLNAIWDLEDQYNALAGSASGRRVAARPAEAAAAPAFEAVSPKTISRSNKVIHLVRKGIKTGLMKIGVQGLRIKKQGASGLMATKSKLARTPQRKT
jgi:hypothetical protein